MNDDPLFLRPLFLLWLFAAVSWGIPLGLMLGTVLR